MNEHILIVEDDVMIQGFLTLTLENEGYRTTAVGSGQGMFSVLEHEKIDLILLDLGLPDSDGLDLTSEIRKTHGMPILVASARRRAQDRDTALSMGADDYLTKPFEPRELIQRIKYYLSDDFVSPAQPLAGGHKPLDPIPETQAASAREPRAEARNFPAEAVNRPGPPPKAGPSNGGGQPTPISAVSRETDRMVMMLGALIIVAAVAGGAYWYYGRSEGASTMAATQTPPSPRTQVVDKQDADTGESPRRGALQPPPVQPSRSNAPVGAQSQPVQPKVASAPKVATQEPTALAPVDPQELPQTVVVEPSRAPLPRLVPSAPAPEIPAEVTCAQLPDVVWWRVKTHDQIRRYVIRKHGGDWQPYVESWVGRLRKLQDIYQRGSAIKTGNGKILQDAELAQYVNQVAKRLEVTKCLAENALLSGG